MDTVRVQRRVRLQRIEEEAGNLATAAKRLEHEASEAMDTNAPALLQPQIGFIVGALMRLTKDAGVVEHLQAIQAEAKGPRK